MAYTKGRGRMINIGKKRQLRVDEANDSDSDRDSDDEYESERDESPPKRVDCDFTNLITIIVGEDEQSFLVHKDMLCAKSKYFESACSELWASGREKVVRPTQGTPKQFKMYSEWVYTSRLNVDAEDPNQQLAELIGMFILGDFLNDHQLRNATMDCLITTILGSTHVFGLDQLDRIYAETPASSPLRRFAVWWVLANVSRKDLESSITQYPAELVQELALAALKQTPVFNDKDSVRVLRAIIKPEKESV